MVTPDPFPDRLRSELTRRGHSIASAARTLGIARQNLATVANPKLSTLIRLVRELGLDARTLAPELFPTRRKIE